MKNNENSTTDDNEKEAEPTTEDACPDCGSPMETDGCCSTPSLHFAERGAVAAYKDAIGEPVNPDAENAEAIRERTLVAMIKEMKDIIKGQSAQHNAAVEAARAEAYLKGIIDTRRAVECRIDSIEFGAPSKPGGKRKIYINGADSKGAVVIIRQALAMGDYAEALLDNPERRRENLKAMAEDAGIPEADLYDPEK